MNTIIKFDKTELTEINKQGKFVVTHKVDISKVITHSKNPLDITIVKVNEDESVELSKFTNPFDIKSQNEQFKMYERNVSLGKSQVGVSNYMIDGNLQDELNTTNILRESQNGKIYFERIEDVKISKDETIRVNRNEAFQMSKDSRKLVSHNDINVNFETQDSVRNAKVFISKVSKRKSKRIQQKMNKRK